MLQKLIVRQNISSRKSVNLLSWVHIYLVYELLLKSNSSFKFKLPSRNGMSPLSYYCPTSRNAVQCSFPTCVGTDAWILLPDKSKYQGERQILEFLWYCSKLIEYVEDNLLNSLAILLTRA